MIFGTIGKPLGEALDADAKAQRKTIGKYFLDAREINQRLNILIAKEIAVGLCPSGVCQFERVRGQKEWQLCGTAGKRFQPYRVVLAICAGWEKSRSWKRRRMRLACL
jgi:hypothetical protein